MNNLSPLSHKINIAKLKFCSFLFPKKNIFKESLECYGDKLPKTVKVSWTRENDGFIVGQIEADGNQFLAQGKNAEDFISMVNDAIYAVYEIPPKYISLLGGDTKYFPPPRVLEVLEDESVKNASFGWQRHAVHV